MVGGWSGLTPVWDHERSRLLLLVGCNPVVSHGHSNAMPDPVNRLRELRTGGGELWVVDPRRTETARLTDRHLQARPGSDWVLLAWLVRRLLDDPARRSEVAGAGERGGAAVVGPSPRSTTPSWRPRPAWP